MDSYFSYTYFPFIVLGFRDLSSLPPSSRTRGLRRAKENSFLAFHMYCPKSRPRLRGKLASLR